jgi:cell division protein ZipA
MEDNFRNVLIILSGIVIGAIFIHGLWTIRKQKNPYKLKASKEKVGPLMRNFDGKGFDQDGVGQVTVKKQSDDMHTPDSTTETGNETHLSNPIKNETAEEYQQGENQLSIDEAPIVDENNDTLNDELNRSADESLDSSLSEHWDDNESIKNFSKDELGDDLTATPEKVTKEVITEPVYQQPVINAKPAIAPVRQSIRKAPSKAELKRNQIEINFGDSLIEDVEMPSISLDGIDDVTETETSRPDMQNSAPTEPKSSLEPQVIILSVVMPDNQQMLGAALLPSLLTLGLKYGEMNIFHRHQDSAGNGNVTFSLANMMKPGSFDLDSMETFATQGISLFMMLPNAADPFTVFEQMLSAAKQLAQEFNGQVLDDKRNVMTKQTEQHYVSTIREFDRKHRIALVE